MQSARGTTALRYYFGDWTRGLLHAEGNLCIFAVSLNQQGVTMRRLLYLLGLLIAGGGR